MREELYFHDLSHLISMNKKKKKKNKPDVQDGAAVCCSRAQPAANRRVSPSTAMPSSGVSAEKALPGSDVYDGGFSGNKPHGSGKYVWSDGCVYDGEWRRGKPSGKGKFWWPTGAAYEGEFRSGQIEGSGTFVGPDGDTYRGSWLADRKHGYGQKQYSNGDFYEGHWRRNLHDGHGRYVWRNGNEYVGQWRNGVISGRGVLTWANGDRFEGQFENGAPKGNSFNNAADNRSSVDSSWRSEAYLPKICIWESDDDAGDITCNIIDTMGRFDGLLDFQRGPSCYRGEVRKPGQAISKGHKNYDLMLNLQLGIRYSVGKNGSPARELQQSDFDPKEKFWTRFPPEGSKMTPPHQSAEFRWKDYCPVVFRHLRKLFQIDPADYMLAICGSDALRELSSPGKSGSFFYLTHDDRFIIKTVKKSEVKVLIRMLPSYYWHFSQYENSLVTKFFGLHCVKPIGGQKTRFVVMGNLFCSEYQIHRRFDLKGSSHGRTIDKPDDEIDETTTLKDLDLNFVFRLQSNWFQELIKQINRDCKFLEEERIMDYSLLVGVHFREDNNCEKLGLSPYLLRSGKKDSFQNEKFMRECRFLEAELQNMDRIISGRKPLIRLGANTPARAERMVRRSDFDQYMMQGGLSHRTHSRSRGTCEVVLYFGIIDILQDYDISKKIEHAYKSLQVDSTSISAVDPKLYSKRFRDFIGRIFIKER
ncbi:hypothetical protein SAY86_031476 [Trapa natans]|uniref:Phosphatidylinositol 4-phosphate 5-kinase n=1 Tax=Trapa natans TaxID=22666 RepID=A0AAN7M3M4_TRANT|nr:hypothetical protein SAY86_031476 [Trapa natans]